MLYFRCKLVLKKKKERKKRIEEEEESKAYKASKPTRPTSPQDHLSPFFPALHRIMTPKEL
jgi:hypothetical protein